jgi:hypothetical protein
MNHMGQEPRLLPETRAQVLAQRSQIPQTERLSPSFLQVEVLQEALVE